ncbi:anhydro-N-acetylmuramic acid kinase [Thalassotalea mangrovi]|uniref:Anhydro-N-acetylmuramic acid kinase n=1 Tax=Thalassotalea mangrovi TaxID=2572245 RepID=A0A4U1BAI5_9GAMM|nr:anhydro-N-acetylmuramic acid kinase [Thalassotalea mangrovi]TKB47846.1 anhydro-N-acetylmuramic acid kinase [Thalassotalea mangrovi]
MSAKIKSQNKSSLYIGLMSGTSADGVDLALVDFNDDAGQLIASYFRPYPQAIRETITSLYVPGDNEIDRFGALDKQLASYFADSINAFLEQQNLSAEQIQAIGNHGQTIRHRPQGDYPFTRQIGCCQTLACITGIRVVGQFREKDMALGGQGAPLVPAYHLAIFANDDVDVCVVNIGGISNISFLPANKHTAVCGFDTGPGNALLDDWYRLHHPRCEQGIDLDGRWAASGAVEANLLSLLKTDPYFTLAFPKSTGREYFHLDWLQQRLQQYTTIHGDLTPERVQATLLALTVDTIADAIEKLTPHARVIVCGGGANNSRLMQQLTQRLADFDVINSIAIGVDNESLEALVFAWLARQYDLGLPSSLPSVTGATTACTLGVEYQP